MRRRPQPIRTCLGCRQKEDKSGLVRIVRRPDGGVAVDPTGRAAGRGAYLHASRDCLSRAARGGAIARALKTSLAQAEAARLMAELKGSLGDDR